MIVLSVVGESVVAVVADAMVGRRSSSFVLWLRELP
jgi:hypothetical protein